MIPLSSISIDINMDLDISYDLQAKIVFALLISSSIHQHMGIFWYLFWLIQSFCCNRVLFFSSVSSMIGTFFINKKTTARKVSHAEPPAANFFPQKFWVKSESTPVFLSKNLSLEPELVTNLNSRQKYAFRMYIEFSRKCIYIQLKPI